MVSSMGFAEGMLIGSVFADTARASGKKMMVFDWIKAAELIRDRQPEYVEAGLNCDWDCTSGPIYKNGKIVPVEETYTYLASIWAIPTMIIDGEEIECFRYKDGECENDWNEKTYWPPEALEILGIPLISFQEKEEENES